MTAEHDAWAELLDEYEARIAACRELAGADLDARSAAYLQALQTGDTVPMPAELVRFVPHAGIGPVPPALRARAQAVLDAGAEVEALLAERRDEVFDRLRSVSSHRRGFPSVHDAPRPRLLDQRG
ncbi:MAG TPA: hypothetical protein VFC33_12360 [Acidimicrobiia bacterium]|nr:hypothetical protein [Acidimicrobiia bacterium]